MEYSISTGLRNEKFTINDDNLLYYATPLKCECEASEILIEKSLENPINAKKLEDDIKYNSKVIIIIDDITRPTPCSKILPNVIKRVLTKTKDIKIITAPGTHRVMTKEELEIKVGKEILEKYPVYNIDYKDEDKYKFVKTTEFGTPVYIHEEILEADYKIGIGNIVPHVVVGWSGGAKILQPGVSGKATTDYTHWAGATKDNINNICGNLDCMCRGEIDAIGKLIGLDYIINTVMDESKNIVGVFSGNFITAHREGVELAKKVLCPKIPEKADIVIASANPCYIDYWQGFKPFAFGKFGLKDDGIMIFIFDAPEGICGNAPVHKDVVVKYMKSSVEQILEDYTNGLINDKVGATNPMNHIKLKKGIKTLCISKYLKDEEYKLLDFEKYETIQEAIKRALEIKGKNSKIGIIPYAGETLVRLD